jgi:hypothetical protein
MKVRERLASVAPRRRRPTRPATRARRASEPGVVPGQLDDLPPEGSDEPRQLTAQERAEAARAEALQDLARLRRRYWSGERILEESKSDLPWWEHPEADPHAVLELLPGASMAEVAAARRAIALRCHPDVTGRRRSSDLAVRRMVAANGAYDRLRRALHPL